MARAHSYEGVSLKALPSDWMSSYLVRVQEETKMPSQVRLRLAAPYRPDSNRPPKAEVPQRYEKLANLL